MPSFGAKLKLEREKRKITLEQISVSTKIGTRMLQALEEDNFNQLPGGIFNKGFVRAYSRFLGLDEDQTIADYMQASGDAPPPSTEPTNTAHEDATRENQEKVSRLEAGADFPSRQVPWGVFAGALLVIALALSFWSHRRREHTRQAARPTPAAAATQVSGQGSGSDSPPASSPTTVSKAGVSTPAVPKTSHDLTHDLTTASSAATPGEFTVVVQAREESWTTIIADGKTISSELLAAGSERAVRGRKEISVRTGNAGAVDFQFNGRKLDTGGEYGEVKTLTFGPQGLLPAAPPQPSVP